ncbi:AbgT family transporter [Vreelandella sp. EE7]
MKNNSASSLMLKSLSGVEKLGNKLPHPFLLFIWLTLIVAIISVIGSFLEWSVIHPLTNETINVRNLLGAEGLYFALTSVIPNFVEFKPLGLVLVTILGVGIAEKTGFFEAVIKKTLLRTPAKLVTYMVFFVGITGNLASDAAYMIVPPLAALIFKSVGRNPIAGLAAGIAAVGCGFTANIFIAGTDMLLSGITTEAASAVDPDAIVYATDNWFFMIASVFFLSFAGVVVSEKIVEPRLGNYKGSNNEEVSDLPIEANKALRRAFISAAIFLFVVTTLCLVPGSILLTEDGGILGSPLLNNIVIFITLFFAVVGIVYGINVNKIKSTKDVVDFMGQTVAEMSGFIVLIFIVSQFIAYLKWTNITIFLAVEGAAVLSGMSLDGPLLLVAFVFLSTFLNMFITSGSAQWSLMAPVFVPMFMILGFEPAFTQLAFRIGDSATNFITPLQPFVAVMLGFLYKYDKNAGFGKHVSLVLPYTLMFLFAWLVLLSFFMVFDLPIGPGIYMRG